MGLQAPGDMEGGTRMNGLSSVCVELGGRLLKACLNLPTIDTMPRPPGTADREEGGAI